MTLTTAIISCAITGYAIGFPKTESKMTPNTAIISYAITCYAIGFPKHWELTDTVNSSFWCSLARSYLSTDNSNFIRLFLSYLLINYTYIRHKKFWNKNPNCFKWDGFIFFNPRWCLQAYLDTMKTLHESLSTQTFHKKTTKALTCKTWWFQWTDNEMCSDKE